jgi:hypothetical protein
MRTIPPALLATLQSDVQTLCTLWKITRTDNQVFGFTDLDVPLTYDGVTYESAGGYTHSQIDMTSDLSTSNLEVQAVFDSSSITPAELESGAWDFAQVVCSIADYTNLAAGAVILSSGTLGQITITNGAYQVELRGLAQLMQQEQGDIYSPTCRAQFGDSKCTIDLAPLTVTGTVGTVNSSTSWNDASLTQVGPTVAYVDTVGHKIPTQSPGQIQIVPPNGGTFVSDTSVIDGLGDIWNKVSSGQRVGALYVRLDRQPGHLRLYQLHVRGRLFLVRESHLANGAKRGLRHGSQGVFPGRRNAGHGNAVPDSTGRHVHD